MCNCSFSSGDWNNSQYDNVFATRTIYNYELTCIKEGSHFHTLSGTFRVERNLSDTSGFPQSIDDMMSAIRQNMLDAGWTYVYLTRYTDIGQQDIS